MNQEEIAALPGRKLVEMARSTVNLGDIEPLHSNDDAIRLASMLDMTISFGDRVVLVSEPAGCQSRTVEYGIDDAISRARAFRRAVTLLAADYSQIV